MFKTSTFKNKKVLYSHKKVRTMIKIFNNLTKVICLIILCLHFVLNMQAANAQSVSVSESETQNTVTFYTGTLFKAVVQQRISTGANNVGDRVEFITPSDIYVGEVTCIPKDSKFIGKIVKLEKPKIGSNGYFQILFHTLRLPDGDDIGIMARVWTKKGDGTIGGEQTLRSTFRPVVQRVQGIGDYIKVVPAGPREMGKDSELLPGYEVLIVLDKKLTFSMLKD